MPLFKKKLTEQEASAQFVLYIMKEVRDAWPSIHKNLKDTFKEKFTIEDENIARFDLALAAIAQDLQAVKNLFPKDQAERMYQWVLHCIDVPEYGEYAKEEVEKYSESFQKSIDKIKQGESENPLDTISTRLLHRWLGENIRNFEIEMDGKKTGIMSPIAVMMVTSILVAFVGTWKRIKENFKLVEGYLPLN